MVAPLIWGAVVTKTIGTCFNSVRVQIWHVLPIFAVDISSEKTEKGYVGEAR